MRGLSDDRRSVTSDSKDDEKRCFVISVEHEGREEVVDCSSFSSKLACYGIRSSFITGGVILCDSCPLKCSVDKS